MHNTAHTHSHTEQSLQKILNPKQDLYVSEGSLHPVFSPSDADIQRQGAAADLHRQKLACSYIAAWTAAQTWQSK